MSALTPPHLRRDALPLSLLAGTSAALAEGLLVGVPLELGKTRAQLLHAEEGPWRCLLQAGRNGVKGVYVGGAAVLGGGAGKTCVRFVAYDRICAALRNDEGVTTGGRALFAGLSAGLLESLLISVPFETLKVRRLSSGLSYSALTSRGLRSVYAGVLPTVLRQSLHGAVRFGSYSSMKNFVQGNSRPGQALPGGIMFALGALAGAVTVYATQPLDVVKTRMQERLPPALGAGAGASSAKASPLPGIWGMARQIAREEGARALWRGATPRLVRLIVGGGVTFLCYEEVVYLANGGI